MQTKSMAIFAVLTLTIAMTLVATISSNQVDAKYVHQKIVQKTHVHQSSSIVSTGQGSSITNSGNNQATVTQTNTGSNVAT